MEHKEPNQIPPRVKRWLYLKNRIRWAVFRRDSFRCRYCNRSVKDGIQLTLDHIKPQSKGGSWSADNLVCACNECNQAKGDSLLTPAELKMFKSPGLLFADWPLVGWKWVMLG